MMVVFREQSISSNLGIVLRNATLTRRPLELFSSNFPGRCWTYYRRTVKMPTVVGMQATFSIGMRETRMNSVVTQQRLCASLMALVVILSFGPIDFSEAPSHADFSFGDVLTVSFRGVRAIPLAVGLIIAVIPLV